MILALIMEVWDYYGHLKKLIIFLEMSGQIVGQINFLEAGGTDQKYLYPCKTKKQKELFF